MDSDAGKLFLGGISWETTEEKIRDHFSKYGEVADAVVMRDRLTGRSRGFGFVAFADPSIADVALLDKHTVDGRIVEVKKALSRDEQQNAMKSSGTGGPKTKKIFVGGLAPNVTEEDFRAYFQQFGSITDVVVMYDPNTQRPRGFGFITFDSEDAVDRVLGKTFHDLKGKMVEVKRAVPKELSMGGDRSGAGAGRGAGYGGPYAQGYNASPGAGGYTPRPSNHLGGGSAGRAGYPYAPTYGATPYAGAGAYAPGVNGGYGAPGFAATPPYGAASGATYTGGYGMAPGAAGYGAGGGYGPPAAGGYGAAGRGTWGGAGAVYSTMPAAGYVAGAAPYGVAGGWGSTLQSPGNSGGYGSDGYGYGGAQGTYTSSASGYPAKGGYTGSGSSGYGDVYENAGYGDGAAAGGAMTAGYAGGGGGGIIDGTSNIAPNAGAGYATSGRQMQRGGPDTRFRPYPVANERAS